MITEQLSIGVDLGPRVDLLEADTCQAKWQAKPGEAFVVRGVTGLEHVVACGDSRRARFVLAVVEMVAASSWLWVTDPPYGIKFHQRTQGRRKGQGGHELPARRKDRDFDGKADNLDTTWLPIWAELAPPCAIYLFTIWRVLEPWRQAMEAIGCKPQQRIVWDRMHFGMGDVSRYGSQLEDMFAGSGPVVLAADGLGRRALAVEASARYVALILERCERAGMLVESRRSIG